EDLSLQKSLLGESQLPLQGKSTYLLLEPLWAMTLLKCGTVITGHTISNVFIFGQITKGLILRMH
ncbi:hypothetical protein STEG23_037374, partial [Scotinomys teguina]